MIKWAGYGKLLKQSFFTLLISCFILLGSSFVSADNYVGLARSFQNGSYVSNSNFGDSQLAVYSRGNLSTLSSGVSKNMLAFQVGGTKKYFWWNNGSAFFYSSYNNGVSAGKFVKYDYCDSITGSTSPYTVRNCQTLDYGSGNSLSGFFSSITSSDYWGYYSFNNSLDMDVCFSSSTYGKSVCFVNNLSSNYESVSMSGGIDFVDFPLGLIGTSPGQNGGGINNGGDNGGGFSIDNSGIALSSDESALNYYEKHYGRDSSICYAGVNSLSYLYGQNGVSFQEGQGLSIFDIFYQLYGNRDLDKVYVWLNSRLINYENRFDSYRDEPSYLVNYNSGTNQVDIYYDNLTFPFANKPVAFYFLASNITSRSERNTMGSSVVSYCNIKINSGTFDEIIDQSQKNNITNYTEKSNTNIGLNPDGTPVQYTGAFLGSGVNLAFSGNTSIKNTLKNFFDELNSSINVVGSGSVSSILPNWLVVGFLTIVLFRFLKRKK